MSAVAEAPPVAAPAAGDAPAAEDRPAVRPAAARRPAVPGLTLADLVAKFGPIPASRIVSDPAPGTATPADHERLNAAGRGIFELIDGTLIEKPVSDLSSWFDGEIFRLLANHVTERKLGWVHPGTAFFNLPDGLRAPDASFTPRDRRESGLQARGYSNVPPALVAEVVSPGNTRREMELKRSVYFAAGVETVWEVDPLARTVTVWTGPDADTVLREGDMLTGAPTLPEFSLPLRDLFAEAAG
ncbi:Uma2 family endonuclease [Alienimonas sp. DA493]|uniref:Uma2 family endonuclease n=1 Tax=Alienimonas sp. DA493 TaxID=3373605 RepID=UPI003754298C